MSAAQQSMKSSGGVIGFEKMGRRPRGPTGDKFRPKGVQLGRRYFLESEGEDEGSVIGIRVMLNGYRPKTASKKGREETNQTHQI